MTFTSTLHDYVAREVCGGRELVKGPHPPPPPKQPSWDTYLKCCNITRETMNNQYHIPTHIEHSSLILHKVQQLCFVLVYSHAVQSVANSQFTSSICHLNSWSKYHTLWVLELPSCHEVSQSMRTHCVWCMSWICILASANHQTSSLITI